MHTFAVARAVRGIEPLVAMEIRRSHTGVVRGVRHREVWFEARPEADLLGLRTADDVLLAAAVVDGIGPARSALLRLARAAREVDPRLMGAPGSGVEVSASFVGRRNYTRFEIEDAVGAELARPLRVPYHSRRDGRRPPAGARSWRVTIEDDQAVIAVRVAARPLHRRAYKTASVRGTLHPPVAAAMAQLARLGGTGTVVDPCCGAGTTLIEARALAGGGADPAGMRFLGFDHDPAAVKAATLNAGPATPGLPAALDSPESPRLPAAPGLPAATGLPGASGTQAAGGAGAGAARVPVAWAMADGGRIPVGDGCADRVLVNPPWGRQVPPAGLLSRGLAPLWREVRRVLAPDGLAVALVHDGIPRGFAVEEVVEVSLSGQHPLIAVLRPR
ncbi:TRM11 family SAM-dependent methyltransferase [Nonomuraea rubra]|uniref:SAM-dependent methyltransferase n=1 Tax=Nonomuraea rubra TaxID=46180 RepID=A0A7X0NQF4_9ACTN|nr:RNA methyltransferase [Nonomuraea rubra]MBB6547722.1 SAM-dependent methyltransferase [Nonomuraea rubra]